MISTQHSPVISSLGYSDYFTAKYEQMFLFVLITQIMLGQLLVKNVKGFIEIPSCDDNLSFLILIWDLEKHWKLLNFTF